MADVNQQKGLILRVSDTRKYQGNVGIARGQAYTSAPRNKNELYLTSAYWILLQSKIEQVVDVQARPPWESQPSAGLFYSHIVRKDGKLTVWAPPSDF